MSHDLEHQQQAPQPAPQQAQHTQQLPRQQGPDAGTPTRPDPTPLQQVAAQVGELWWIPLAAGIASIVLGVAVLTTDWTVKALVVLIGLVLVLRGAAMSFDPSYAADRSWWHLLAGVVVSVCGLVLVAWPAPTLVVLAVVAGTVLAASGAFQVVSCIARRHTMGQWGLGVAIGVVELLLGIWMMRRPEVTLTLVVTVLGAWAVITGVIRCVQAFEIRDALRAARAGAGQPS